jgi:cytoskeletal protein CcmA (bactofilin family)
MIRRLAVIAMSVAVVVAIALTASAVADQPARAAGAHRFVHPDVVGPPTAPYGLNLTTGSKTVTLKWSAPVSNGGSPLAYYIVTTEPGGATTYAGGAATSAKLTGLTNGSAYTFSMTATNQAGYTSVSSGTTLPATPANTSLTCTVTWTGSAGDGQWSTAANWSTGVVPGASDTACVPSSAGAVNFNTTDTVKAVKLLGASFSLSGGTLTLSDATHQSQLANMTAAGGSLEASAGGIALSGSNTWSSGTVSNAVVGKTATLALDNDFNTGHLINRGTFTLNGHELHVFDGAVVDNYGTLNMSDNNSYVNDANNTSADNGSLRNEPGAKIKATASSGSAEINTATFDNLGIVSLTGAQNLYIAAGNSPSTSDSGSYADTAGPNILFYSGTRSLGPTATVANVTLEGTTLTGTLAGAGPVQLQSGTYSGTIAAGTPVALVTDFDIGNVVNNGTLTLSGHELHVFDGDELQNNGTVNMSRNNSYVNNVTSTGGFVNEPTGTITASASSGNAEISTATFDNLGTLSVTGAQNLYIAASSSPSTSDSGSYADTAGPNILFYSGTRSLGPTATLANVNVQGTTLSGTLAGAGPIQLQSGTYSGTIDAGTPVELVDDFDIGNVVNNGTLTLNDHELHVFDGDELQNNGTLDMSGNNSYVNNVTSTGAFVNEPTGTITATAASGTAEISTATFDNLGTLSLTGAQSLYIAASSSPSTSDSGSYSDTAGANIFFYSGTRSLGPTATVANVTLQGATLSGTLAGAGPVQLQSGTYSGTIDAGTPVELVDDFDIGNVVNNGTLTLNEHQLHVFDGDELQNNGTLNMSGNNSYVNNVASTGAFVNEPTGTITATAASGTAEINTATFDNLGTVSLTGAQVLYVSAAVANIASGTISGGTWDVDAGTLQVNGADITTDDASVTLGGGAFEDLGSNPSFANLGTVGSSGTLTLSGTTSLSVSGPLSNTGHVNVGSGTTLTSNGRYTQSAGATVLTAGGSLQATGEEVDLTGGTLTGTGASGPLVVNQGGTISPGVGTDDIPSLQQSAGGTLIASIHGVNPGTGYTQVSVAGDAVAGGTLVLNKSSGFSPAVGQNYTILVAAVRVGVFGTVTDNLGVPVSLTYSATSIVVTVN